MNIKTIAKQSPSTLKLRCNFNMKIIMIVLLMVAISYSLNWYYSADNYCPIKHYFIGTLPWLTQHATPDWNGVLLIDKPWNIESYSKK